MIILQHRFALIRRYVLGVLLLVPLLFAPGAPSQAAMVFLDFTGVAVEVNEGPVFNPASDPNGAAQRKIKAGGCAVASDGQVFEL